nr:mitochondrial inner membrane protease subunit 1 isoform X2 [Pelodiscus sinensis]|eukprot:XP_006128963.1 mitochondrial inner membrane protease subunit 1 isoform X2 [Pelodiscus sinensis]
MHSPPSPDPEINKGTSRCSGPSMEPTIQNSDIVVSENLSCRFYSIQKGDIVIAKSPNDPKSNICKRVIGLEGDKVCTSSPSDFRKSHSYVPKGHVWLEGDNLRNSTDSRCYGPVPYGLIRGRIYFKMERGWGRRGFISVKTTPTSRTVLQGYAIELITFLRQVASLSQYGEQINTKEASGGS